MQTHRLVPLVAFVPFVLTTGAAAADVGGATAASAAAVGDTRPRGELPMIDGGLELVLAIGGARSAGVIGGGLDAGELIGTATEVELQVGHRVTPHLTLSFYATAQDHGDGSTSTRDVHTGSAGVEADLHLRPASSTDPWLSLGTGVRAILDHDDGTTLVVGAELARVQLGLDLRINQDVAISPLVGASATLYGARRTPMDGFAELADKGVTWTFSAGVAARFDLFGTRPLRSRP